MNDMPICLECAREADLSAIVALMNSAFRGDESKRGWSTEAEIIKGTRTTESLLKEEIAGGAFYLIVRGGEGEPLKGCVCLQHHSPELWHLGALTVQPGMQNAGFGRQLLFASEQYAAEHGARTIEMTVVSLREALIAWYERRGYRLTGETRPFPYGDERNGVPARDDLEFLVMKKDLSEPGST